MAGQKFTQKQIAEKYKGNLDYFKKGHYLRNARAWAFLVVAVVSIVGVLSFRFWGKSDFLTTGPISENHSRIANDCRVCHIGADPDVLALLKSHKSGENAGGVEPVAFTPKSNDAGIVEKGLALTSLSLMDQACLKCHGAMGLHQPQSAGLALRTVRSELSVVHATNCALCHREHVGHERMALPSSQTCAACHNNAERLESTHQMLKLDNPPIAAVGESRDLGDGLLHYITPTTPALKPFASYVEGHPPFEYETPNLRDPGTLKFNHARHERGDLPKINGRKMTCTDCHKPGAGGTFYQRVTYEQSCQPCHTLQIQPSLPKVLIPHGDPQKVRYFLASLKLSFAEALRADGVSDPVDLDRQTTRELEKLQQRGLNTINDLEQRVFFTGDPSGDEGDLLTKRATRKFLTECAKCHTVGPGNANNAPSIAPVKVTDRWIQHGPFTHVPHQHMSCIDCHGAAQTSKLTSDILMPPQKICAECHRPREHEKVDATVDTLKLKAVLAPETHELAAAQRRTGGVKSDCQACHAFHAPAAATVLVETKK